MFIISLFISFLTSATQGPLQPHYFPTYSLEVYPGAEKHQSLLPAWYQVSTEGCTQFPKALLVNML